MSDLREYILKQRETYSLEDIEASLLEQGMDETIVKETIAEIRDSAGPEIPDVEGSGTLPSSDGPLGAREDTGVIKLTLIDALPNGITALIQPTDYFARMEKKGGFIGPMYTILFWVLAATFLSEILDFRKGGSVFNLIGFFIEVALYTFPVTGLAALPVMVYTVIFYFMCSVNGGTGSFEASFRAIASLSALMPVCVLLVEFFPLGIILLVLYGLLISIYAGAGIHGLTWWRSFFSHILFFFGGIAWLIFS